MKIDLPPEFDGLLLLEPRDFFDPFIVGIGERFHDRFVVYDRETMLIALAAENKDDPDYDPEYDAYTEALEHYEFNIRGGWVGDTTPAFVSYLQEDHSTKG